MVSGHYVSVKGQLQDGIPHDFPRRTAQGPDVLSVHAQPAIV